MDYVDIYVLYYIKKMFKEYTKFIVNSKYGVDSMNITKNEIEKRTRLIKRTINSLQECALIEYELANELLEFVDEIHKEIEWKEV